MSGKVKVILGVLGTAILVSGIWATVMHFRTKAITEKFEGEISQLTATLDALGPSVDCYTVTEEYCSHYDNDTTGQIIQDNGLQVISVPSSLVGDSYVQDPSEIVGKYFKINVKPGTPITRDLVMAEKYDDTLRDVDIVVNSWVVGMREGDYVDINLTLPWGQDYIVLPHKRVMQINDKTVKMYMTEEEWHTYQSALVDWYLNSSRGARLYFKKYVEPGVQEPAQPYYTLTAEVQSAVQQDPNITNKAFDQMVSTTRPAIDAEFGKLRTEQDSLQKDAGLISSGRNTYTSDIMSDVNVDLREQQNAEGEEDTYEVQDVDIQLDGSPSEEETTSSTEETTTQETVETPVETDAPEETATPEESTEAPDVVG